MIIDADDADLPLRRCHYLSDLVTSGRWSDQCSDRCDELATEGRDALVRTNVILIASSAVALATVTLALFFTEWKSRPMSGRAAAFTF